MAVEFVVAELAEPATDKAASAGDFGDELLLEMAVPGRPREPVSTEEE